MLELIVLALLAAGAAAGAVAIVFLAIITMVEIFDWFRSRSHLRTTDKDIIAFTLKEALASGKHSTVKGAFASSDKQYKVVQGFFNTKTGKLVDARQIHSDRIDAKVREAHSSEALAIYE